MMRLIAALFVGYYVGKRGFSQSLSELEVLVAQNKDYLAQLENEI